MLIISVFLCKLSGNFFSIIHSFIFILFNEKMGGGGAHLGEVSLFCKNAAVFLWSLRGRGAHTRTHMPPPSLHAHVCLDVNTPARLSSHLLSQLPAVRKITLLDAEALFAASRSLITCCGCCCCCCCCSLSDTHTHVRACTSFPVGD